MNENTFIFDEHDITISLQYLFPYLFTSRIVDDESSH